MRPLRSLLLAGLLGAGLAAVLLWARRGPPPPLRPERLPDISPRGDRLRGVEVFALGPYRPGQLVALCEAVHAAVSRTLGTPPTSPSGLRVHVFPDRKTCRDYVRRATGQERPGAAYVFLGGDRLVVLSPEDELPMLQHEVAHDAVQLALGEVPRWFSEGVAVRFESWRWEGAGLVPGPPLGWADRFLDRSARGQLPPSAALGDPRVFERSDDVPAYARSWATVEALSFLRAGAGPPLGPAPDLDREGLDALGALLATWWGRPAQRIAGWLRLAKSEPGPRAQARLDLAEGLAARDGRLPWSDPLPRFPELARALAKAARDPRRRLRAACALAERSSASPADQALLAAALAAAGAPRAAAQARSEPPPLPREASVLLRAQGDLRLRLSSRSWDQEAASALADALLEAVVLLRRADASRPTEWRFSVEVPGVRGDGPPGRRLEGWPGSPALLARAAATLALDARLRGEGAPSRGALRLALAAALDPWVAARARAAARAARRGPRSVEALPATPLALALEATAWAPSAFALERTRARGVAPLATDPASP
ncbi:MAG: hypothetical protein D6731_02750, partial [Planctomycetota bacterium]